MTDPPPPKPPTVDSAKSSPWWRKVFTSQGNAPVAGEGMQKLIGPGGGTRVFKLLNPEFAYRNNPVLAAAGTAVFVGCVAVIGYEIMFGSPSPPKPPADEWEARQAWNKERRRANVVHQSQTPKE